MWCYRGILPTRVSDMTANRKQLRDIIFSTYSACVCPDVDGDGKEFKVTYCVLFNVGLGQQWMCLFFLFIF